MPQCHFIEPSQQLQGDSTHHDTVTIEYEKTLSVAECQMGQGGLHLVQGMGED